MKIVEDYALLETGIRVFYRCVVPEKIFHTLIIGSHGLTAHSGIYIPIAEEFARHGFGFCMHDQRGHGRTAGENDKGYVEDFQYYVEDIKAFSDYARWCVGAREVILLGHSMGGLIVLLTAATHKGVAKGVIALAPALQIPLNPVRKLILSLALRFAPRSKILLQRGPPEEIEGFQKAKDLEYSLREVSVKLINEMIKASHKFWRLVGDITVPVLLIHGEKDKVIPFEASKRAYQLLASYPKELKLYPDLGHNLFFEPGGEKVVKDIIDWVSNLPRENP
ncbi:MAG: lysophospholipase [Thermosphaera sp.]